MQAILMLVQQINEDATKWKTSIPAP